MLALAGGALGILVAWLGLRGLVALVPPPGGLRIAPIAMNARMLGATVLLSLITGVVFGVAPALAAFQPDLTGWLKQSTRATGTAYNRHPRRGARVSMQIALALILLP